MLNCQKILAAVGGFVLASHAYSNELDASLKAPIHNIFPNAYSSVEMSHQFKNLPNARHSRVDALYTLGSTFFDERLDSFFVLGVKKYENSSQIYQKSINWETRFTAYNNEYFAVKPYVLAFLPYTDSKNKKHSTEGFFGVELPVSYDIAGKAGVLTLGAYYDVSANFNNLKRVSLRNEKGEIHHASAIDVKNATPQELSLTKKDNEDIFEVQPKALAMRQDVAATLAFTPASLPSLSLEWRTRHRVDSTPIMVYDTTAQTVTAKKGSFLGADYSNKGSTTHRLRAKYDLTDVVFLQNDFNFLNKLEKGDLMFQNTFTVGAYLF